VIADAVPLRFISAAAFGFSAALFWSSFQASYLALRPGQAGTSQAVVSTIGLFGIGFPALVGAVSDATGLSGGLTIYAAVPLLMLVLLSLRRDASDRRA
jgi:hypothetical protein